MAVDGCTENPGVFRQRDVVIAGSSHLPPPWQDVPGHVAEMLHYINVGDDLHRDAIHLAAYAMWRLNWIHPFEEGNGRTARAVSYLVLCVGINRDLPGAVTLIERCQWQKIRYNRCLEAADAAYKEQRVDVSALEEFLQELLEAQLRGHVA